MRLHSGLAHLLTVPSADAAGARPPRVTANPEHSRSHPLRKLLSSNLDKACPSCSCKTFLADWSPEATELLLHMVCGKPSCSSITNGMCTECLKNGDKGHQEWRYDSPTSELVGLFRGSVLRAAKRMT